jgi:hypothetical protein
MVLSSEFRVTFLHPTVVFLLSSAWLSILVANTIIGTIIQLCQRELYSLPLALLISSY